jgi:hypothetical protein
MRVQVKTNARRASSALVRTTKRGLVFTGRLSKRITVKTAQHSKKVAIVVHHRTATRPHELLQQKSPKYANWHQRRYHGHVHYGALGMYLFVVGLMIFNSTRFVFAADQTDNWNFASSGDYTVDDGVEVSGNTARLKAQEYASDGNTSGLYPLNESSGSTASDESSNNNDLALQNSPTFGTGNLNNGLTLNGTNQYGQASDSSSLSMTGQQTIEGWIKPDATFDNATNQDQTIVDKGSYRLNMDGSSGKIAYEIQNSGSDQWTKRLGDEQAGSWPFNHYSIDSMVSYGTDIYAGIGLSRGDGEVWKYNGTSWSKVGGDGLNSSWADQTYEQVTALATNGTALYAGLGNSAGDAEVWTCNLATSCATWSKIGGDGVGGITNVYQNITTLTTFGGSLYAGTGTGTAGYGDVFKYNGGTSWTQVGGDGLNNGWAASTYETVASLHSDGTNLYAGLGTTRLDAEVWSYNGTTWAKIGGDSINGGWSSNFETVRSMTSVGGSLYAGLGDGAQEAAVYKYTAGTWTYIGGNPLAGTWNRAALSQVASLTNDGTNVYAGLGTGSSGADIYKYNGSSWTKIAGGGTNSSWTGPAVVGAMVWANSKLYAAPWSSTVSVTGAGTWEFNGSSWTQNGGNFVNDSWGGFGVTRISSSATYNSKLYYGLGGNVNSAHVYEYDGTTARRIGGAGKDGSWPANTYEEVTTLQAYGGSLYAGLGSGAGDGELWRWDGTSWTKIGGDGQNSSWNNSENTVSSMAAFNGKLYVGLGTDAYEGDIWEWNGTTWTIVAGTVGNTISPTINSSWSTNARAITSMTVYNGQLCVGWGGTGGTAQVWCWSGSGNWTQIADNAGLNGSWSSRLVVDSLVSWRGKMYAGVWTTTGHIAAVWEWNGSTWTQIAGSDINNTWSDGTYSYTRTLNVYNGELYAGVGFSGSSNPTGDVWKWNGSTWSQVGGDGLSSSWSVGDGREEVSNLITYKGKLYAGLGFSASADALVYSYGNNAYIESTTSTFDTSWKHIAATYDGVNMKLFINGVQDATRATAASGVDSDMPLLLGTGFGSPKAGSGQQFFKGQLDEVRISNTARTSFNSKPYLDSPQAVSLASAVRQTGILNWDSFQATEAANGGTISYQLSDDEGETWKYWNGSNWVEASSYTDSNALSVINDNIGVFPVGFGGITWQAILDGDGTQRVTLNSVSLGSNLDGDTPDTNASAIQASKSNGGASLGGGSWANGASPYFEWTAAADSGSGVKGYCLYLGTDNSADPVSAKGLLGTSPSDSGGNCEFLVTGTTLDLATSGYLSTPLTTSDADYYLSIKALDNAGNVFGSSEQFTFKFDNTPPANPGYVTAPSSFINTKTATLTWPTAGGNAPSDSHSGLAGLQYRVNATDWYGDDHTGSGDINDLLDNDGEYTTVDPPDFDNINDGVNTIYFRTWDQAGNVTTNYTNAALKVNTSGAPSEPQAVTATPSTNTSNSFAFDWDAPNTYVGAEGSLSYCYTINVVPSSSSCNYTAAGVTNLPAGAYATQPGTNTFYVVARDESNNINYSSYGSATFTANTPAPGIPTNIDIADVSVKASSNWRLAITWDPPVSVGAGVSAYRVYRSTNNVSFTQVGTSSSTSYVDTGLSEVLYYYKVKACDSANNCGADTGIVSLTPTGKFTSPANITSQPAVTNVTTKKARISWSTDRASDSKVALGTKSGVYSPSEVGNSSQVTAHSLDLDNLAAGTTYYFQAKWTDTDGNTGTSQEYTFTTAPAPILKEVETTATTLSGAIIRFTSKEATKVNIYFGKTDGFGGVKTINTSLSESTYTFNLEGLDDGTKYFYKLSTFDEEGTEYGGNIFSFSTPSRPRIADLRFQPVEGEPTSTQKITWATNVPTSSQITYGKIGASGVEINSSNLKTKHEMVIRNLEDNSRYFLVAQGRDKGGNVASSDRQEFKTALDTRPPEVSDISVEVSIKGTGAEARGQVVVSWKTDEPSSSQVAYAEGSDVVDFNNKSTLDDTLTTEHIVIVSDLPTSKLYSIQPLSSDKSGNEGKGEVQSAIVGKASDSVLTIILNTLQDIFGF